MTLALSILSPPKLKLSVNGKPATRPEPSTSRRVTTSSSISALTAAAALALI
jgi:hypothetical protein